eukprot:10606290-Alexandrium_andersonii.AAC.1
MNIHDLFRSARTCPPRAKADSRVAVWVWALSAALCANSVCATIGGSHPVYSNRRSRAVAPVSRRGMLWS